MIIHVWKYIEELRALGFEQVREPYDEQVYCPSINWLRTFADYCAGRIQALQRALPPERMGNGGFDCDDIQTILRADACISLATSTKVPRGVGHSIGCCDIGILSAAFDDGVKIYLGAGQSCTHAINLVRCDDNEIYFVSGFAGQIELAKVAIDGGRVAIGGAYWVRV